jgi:hypothetical protein
LQIFVVFSAAGHNVLAMSVFQPKRASVNADVNLRKSQNSLPILANGAEQ